MKALRIALATDAAHPDLSPDDRILAEALRTFADVRPIVWSEANESETYDVCVVRSTWDSHLHPEAFLAWVRGQAARARLFNSARLLEWNFHKRYLLELESAGVPIIPTLLYEKGAGIDARERIADAGWNDVVVKPAISASAYKTRRFENALEDIDAVERYAADVLNERDVMIQPLKSQVFTSRERSAVYIAGEFSHAARRLPFGAITPNRAEGEADVPFGESERAFCENVLRRLPELPLYARVDYVIDREGPMLMEVELIDPSLFFQHRPESARNFAGALKKIAA